jgi:hypothetical protein
MVAMTVAQADVNAIGFGFLKNEGSKRICAYAVGRLFDSFAMPSGSSARCQLHRDY